MSVNMGVRSELTGDEEELKEMIELIEIAGRVYEGDAKEIGKALAGNRVAWKTTMKIMAENPTARWHEVVEKIKEKMRKGVDREKKGAVEEKRESVVEEMKEQMKKLEERMKKLEEQLTERIDYLEDQLKWERRKNIRCYTCNKVGHIAARCYSNSTGESSCSRDA